MKVSVFKKQGSHSMFSLLLLFMLINIHTPLHSQIPNNDTTAYYAALNSISYRVQPDNPLPLTGFDRLRPALLSIGMGDDQQLWQTLNTYLPIGRLNIEDDKLTCQWPDYPSRSADFNLMIIAFDAQNGRISSIPDNELIFQQKIPIIYIIFGTNIPLNMPSVYSSTTLYSEHNTPWSQSVLAQLIFGGLSTDMLPWQPLFTPNSSKTDKADFKPPQRRFSFAPPAVAGMNAAILEDSIAAIVNDGLSHHAFPGAQVLVAKNGIIVYHKAFGFHTDKQERPVQLTDIYDLASISKTSSGLAALMRWYGENKFDLDAPLSQYYPKAKDSNKAHLSYRSMLAHHARLRPWIPYWQNTLRGNGHYPWSKQRDPLRINDYRFKRHTFKRDSSAKYPIYIADDLWQHKDYQQKMIEAIMASPLNDEAGYRYSGLLFYLLPDIVAQQSGMDFETYLQQTFYRPLGAYTLGYNPYKRFPLDRIIPTEQDTFFRMTQIQGHVHDEGAAMMGGVSCNAGLFASAYDLAKLQQMYLNFGSYGGRQYIQPKAVKEFIRCQYCSQDNRRGLGFDKPPIEYNASNAAIAEAASADSFGHAGYTGTFTWADPDNGLLFIFMSNRVYPRRTNRGLYSRNIRPRIHRALYQAL